MVFRKAHCVMEHSNFNIVKPLIGLITLFFFISWSIKTSTFEHEPLHRQHISSENSNSDGFLQPDTYNNLSSALTLFPLPHSGSEIHEAHSHELACLRAEINSLQAVIEYNRTSGARNREELIMAEEALNELLRIEILLKSSQPGN